MGAIDLFDNMIYGPTKWDPPTYDFLDTSIFENSADLLTGYLTGTMDYHEDDPWIQTYSGRRFNPLNPIPRSIVIQDIAHALSMQCRYNGHCNEFYSVAQHSVIVSYLCDAEDALDGLLHDATEAYIADISSPLKRSNEFSFYRDIETNLQRAVSKRFNISAVEKPSVKRADVLALATEANCLLNCRPDWILPVQPAPFDIVALGPKEARSLFLNRFFQLLERPDIQEKYSSDLDKLSNEEITEALFGKK